MGRFDHLKALEVTGASRSDYVVRGLKSTLPGCEGKVTVTLSPSSAKDNRDLVKWSMSNAEYEKERVKSIQDVIADKELTAHDINDVVRVGDRRIYAEVICKGWEGVQDHTGKPVKFSKASALEWLEAIPSWAFDDMREHAQDPRNFVKEWKPQPALKDVSKNS